MKRNLELNKEVPFTLRDRARLERTETRVTRLLEVMGFDPDGKPLGKEEACVLLNRRRADGKHNNNT